jgi:hypothetical protein
MRKIILLLVVAFFFSGIAYSQQLINTANKKPFITLETSGSLEIPIMDLKESNGIGGVYKFTDYGASTGFGGAINLKFAVYSAKRTQLRTYLNIGYSQFGNDENKAYVYSKSGWVNPGYPYEPVPGTKYVWPVRDTAGTSNMRMNVPYLAVGGEFGVYTDKRNRSSLNFGLDFLISVIFGKYAQTIYGQQEETYTTLNSNTRLGLGLNASYSLRFSEVVGFHVGTRLAIPNLFSKSSEISDGDAAIYLLDKEDKSLNANLSSNRTLGYFKFYGGLSLFFGKL